MRSIVVGGLELPNAGHALEADHAEDRDGRTGSQTDDEARRLDERAIA